MTICTALWTKREAETDDGYLREFVTPEEFGQWASSWVKDPAFDRMEVWVEED